MGRATEGAAFDGDAGETATATDLTATEGVAGGSTAAGRSDNGDKFNGNGFIDGNGLNDMFGEFKAGTGADGTRAPVGTILITCALAACAASHATIDAAKTRLTRAL